MTIWLGKSSSTNLLDNLSNTKTIVYNQHEQLANQLPCAEKSGYVNSKKRLPYYASWQARVLKNVVRAFMTSTCNIKLGRKNGNPHPFLIWTSMMKLRWPTIVTWACSALPICNPKGGNTPLARRGRNSNNSTRGSESPHDADRAQICAWWDCDVLRWRRAQLYWSGGSRLLDYQF